MTDKSTKSSPTFSDLVMAVESAQSTALDNQELRKFVTLLAKLHGRDPDDVMREFINADPEVGVDAVLTQSNEEQAQEAIDAARPRRRGRPSTMGKRHKRIACSIEAFRAAGLSKGAATVESARAWGLSEDTVRNLYKDFKLPAEAMNWVREHFAGCTTEEVQEAIKQFRSADK